MENEQFDYTVDELFEQLKADPSWNDDAEERTAIANELKMTLSLLGY
ncbi:hypothetical protein LPY66_06145 [Dehalobacter sp. DCM]|nr:hypothetical protein LPY66_06145 [Dehalobacter sp. DCM]